MNEFDAPDSSGAKAMRETIDRKNEENAKLQAELASYKDEKLNDAFDDLFNGVNSDKLNLTHLDIPEVWELIEPYYNKFIQIYNDICSFNRMNYIENDECLRITWETINGDTNQTMTYETPIDSVRGRLNATEFIYNIGGFNQPNSVKLDIVYKST